jgi:hypothetical protein
VRIIKNLGQSQHVPVATLEQSAQHVPPLVEGCRRELAALELQEIKAIGTAAVRGAGHQRPKAWEPGFIAGDELGVEDGRAARQLCSRGSDGAKAAGQINSALTVDVRFAIAHVHLGPPPVVLHLMQPLGTDRWLTAKDGRRGLDEGRTRHFANVGSNRALGNPGVGGNAGAQPGRRRGRVQQSKKEAGIEDGFPGPTTARAPSPSPSRRS